MGTFTIFSIGDAAFLEQILIAVAMITGTGDFEKMIATGLLLGVLIICIQSVFQGARQINFQQILVCWILYACFFVPSTTVTIEDAYTGQVRVVSNVPLGVGVAGGIISNIGYTVTKLFETGYGVIVPSVTENRFSESLKILNDVRRRSYDSAVFSAWNTANGGGYVDIRRSWSNYIRECTLTKVDLNLISLDELMNRNTDVALRFNSQLYGTRLYLSAANPDGADYTCTDGWTALSAATANLSSPLVGEVLNNLLAIDTSTGENAFTKINNSLQAMGATTTTAIEYLRAAVLEPLYYEAAAGRYQDMQDFGSALMINQAIQQRNTQWAAEQSMFMTVVRPMLTFFEGFVYAITPIMGFIMVLGSFGLSLAGKYFQTILWIQLWMPVLSIINLFVHTAATNEMASLSSNGLNSIYALASTGDVLQNWIATGGMLAAATPVISLFIVTGSTYAFTGLANRINGADHTDEKIQSPDALKPAPVMASQPAYDHNQFSGTLATGTSSMIGTLSLGTSLASGVSSAQAAQNQKTEAFQSSLSRAFSDGVSQDQSYSRLSNIGRTISSQGTSQSQLISQQAKNFSDQFQIGDSHQDAVRGAFALQAVGAVSVEKSSKMLSGLGVKGGASAQGSSESSANDSSTWSANDVSQFVKNIGFSKTDSQALTNQLAEGFSRSGGESFRQTWGDSLSNNLSQSASELVSASKTFSSMSEMRNQLGSMTNTDFKTLGGAVAQTPAAMAYLDEHFRNASPAVRQEATALDQRYRSYGMTPTVALAAARLTAMTNPKNYETGKELGGFQAALETIGMATGRSAQFEGDAYAHQGMNMPNVPGVRGAVTSAVGSGPALPSNFRASTAQMATTSPESEAHELPESSSLAVGSHLYNSAALSNTASQRDQRISAPEIKRMQDNMLRALPPMSWSASGWGAYDNSRDWFARRAEQAGGALMVGAGATSDTFSKSMKELSEMSPEQRDQFIAATRSGDEAILKDFGWAGSTVLGATKLGRNIIGAAASGYSAAKEWITGKSDLSEAAKGMNMEERGAFYAAAFASSAEAGAETAQAFMQQYGAEFKEAMQTTAQSRLGLTHTQAAIYAESFDTDKEKMGAAINNLKMEYAERDSNGNVMFDADGKPILSEDNEKFTDKLATVIQNASTAGERSGSYLTAVRGYNAATQRIN